MKIAIDMTSFNNSFIGGKEQVAINLLYGFKENGYINNVIVFCYDYYLSKIENIVPRKNIIVFKRNKIKKLIQDIFIRTFKINKYLDEINLLLFPIYYTGFKKFKIPTVIIPHDIHFKIDKNAYDLFTKLKDTFFYYVDFKLRDNIIAISDYDKKMIKEYYPKFRNKIMKIYNPIRIVNLKDDVVKEKKDIVIVNFGFVHKNSETIIKAFNEIKDKTEHNLILIGKEYSEIKLSDMIKNMKLEDRVHFTGFIDEEKKNELLKNAALYVTASKHEGFGMPSVEALILKTAVLSSYQEALVETTFNKARYYENYTDYIELSKNMIDMLKTNMSNEYFENMKNKALATYSYQKISKEYIDFFIKSTNKVFYVDPMSYHNLALYDQMLLSNIDKKIDLTFFGNKQYKLEEPTKTIKIYNYSMYNNSIIKAFSYLNSQRKLFMSIKNEKCSVVHLQWSRMPLIDYYLFKRAKKKFNFRFIYTSHDTFSHNLEKDKKKLFLKLMSVADCIITHTNKGEKILNKHNFKKTTVIDHGLLDIRKVYKEEKIDFEKKNKIVFSLLGFMEEYKGTDLLIKAWLESDYLMKNEKFMLVVIGKNRLKHTPKIPKDSNILFRDKLLSDGEFTKWMDISDLIVLPYQQISQSGLLLTGLSMNKHFIVNDIGELAKPVKKYGVGWCINGFSTDSLKVELEKIAKEIIEAGLRDIGDDIIRKVDNDYSWEKSGKLTSMIYYNNENKKEI